MICLPIENKCRVLSYCPVSSLLIQIRAVSLLFKSMVAEEESWDDTHIDLTRCKTIPPEAMRAMSSCTRKARSWKLRMTLVHFLPQIHISGPVILQWQFYERALSRSMHCIAFPSTECFLSDAWLLSPFFFGLTGGVTEFATLCLVFIPQTTEYAPTDEAAMDPDLYSKIHINISSIDLSGNFIYVRLRRDVIFRCICHPDSGDSGDSDIHVYYGQEQVGKARVPNNGALPPRVQLVVCIHTCDGPSLRPYALATQFNAIGARSVNLAGVYYGCAETDKSCR